jgi:hypothetical protein
MRILKSLAAGICATAFVFFVTAAPVQAQEPHYLRALSDLRTARDYINSDHRPGFQGKRDIAVGAINQAISEIKHAAWDDGKNTRYAPPSGMVDPWFPIHEAMKALSAAHRNIEQGVDRPENAGLRHRAIYDLEQAQATVNDILTNEHH